MVCRLNPADCYCETCNGGDRAPPGYFGGTYCPCRCHSLSGDERTEYLNERRKNRDAVAKAMMDDFQKKLTAR